MGSGEGGATGAGYITAIPVLSSLILGVIGAVSITF